MTYHDAMTETPKRLWARRHPTGVVEAADYKIEGEQQYHRADLSADLVRAALEAAAAAADKETKCALANSCNQEAMGAVWAATAIRTLSADPEAVAAIVAQVMEKEHD